MAATIPIHTAVAEIPGVRFLVVDKLQAPRRLLPAPTVLLVSEWQQALKDGRSPVASGYRQLVDAIADEEPTWEDAEWQ